MVCADAPVVVISHDLHDVFVVSDRIVVLRLGRRCATFETATASQQAVVAAITGADQEARAPALAGDAGRPA